MYAGYGTTPTAGDMSKATTASKFQKFGKNYIQNHNAELTSDWSFISATGSTGTKEYATDDKYLGSKSIKITKTNTTSYECARQTLTLEKGKTYTYSGYVKTSNVSDSALGALLQVTYYDSAGTGIAARTTCLKGTNGWDRYSTTFTIPADSSTTTAYAFALVWNSTGTAWFDCLQLEEGPIANRYNIVNNADFHYVTSNLPDDWTRSATCGAADIIQTSADSTNPITNDDTRFRIFGDPDDVKTLSQTLYLYGNQGDTYVVGGWAKGNSVPLVDDRKFAVVVFFDYTSYTDETLTLSFSQDTDLWQYLCGAVVAKHPYQNMSIKVEYDLNANSADFDAIQLFKEEFGNTFEYDSNGNLTKVTDASKKDEEFQYSTSNDLTKYIDPNSKEFNFTYDSKHNLLTATSAEGIVYTYSYDSSNGNQLSAKAGGSTNYVRSTVTYASNGNYTDIVTDPFGEQVDYNFNTYKGTLDTVTDPLG